MANTTSKVLAENVRPMQTPEESLLELEELEKNGELQVDEEAKKRHEELVQKRNKVKRVLLKYDVSEEDANIISSHYKDPDFYPYRLEPNAKAVVILNTIKQQQGLSESLDRLYKRLLVTVFSEGADLTKEDKALFSSDAIASYAKSCFDIKLSPFDVSYVKPNFDREKQEIKPVVLLAGYEHILMKSAKKVKIKYEYSDRLVDVYLPIDPDQDLNSFDNTDMYWDSEKTSTYNFVKCIISYSDDEHDYEVEGTSFALGDIALTPFWAKNHLLMMQHVAFKRASKLIINNPISCIEDAFMVPVMTEKQLEKKVAYYCREIESATEFTIGVIQRSITSHKKQLGKHYDELARLLAVKIASINKIKTEKAIVVSNDSKQVTPKSKEDLENENGFKILTNDELTPVNLSDAEKQVALASLGVL